MHGYQQVPAAEAVPRDTAHAYFEQAVVEAVMAFRHQGTTNIGLPTRSRALSEEILTACVMQGYQVYLAAKRELGAKIGSAKQPAA